MKMSIFAAVFAAGMLLSIPLASATTALPAGADVSGPWCVYYWYTIGDYTITLPYATLYVKKIASGSGKQCVCDPNGGPCKILAETNNFPVLA